MSTGRKRLLAYVIMMMSALISVKLVKDIVKLTHVDERIIAAEKELQLAQEEQLKLEREIVKVESGEMLEKQIRDTLKMARENEEVVIIPDQVLEKSSLAMERTVSEEENLSNFSQWRRVFGIMD